MSDSVQVRMIRGVTYANTKIFPKNPCTKGEVRDVSEEDAEYLLNLTYKDITNNELHYFEQVVEGESSETSKAPRRVRKAKAEA